MLCIQQLTGLIPTEFSSFFRWLSVFVCRPGELFSSPSSVSSSSIFLLLILFNLQVYLDRSRFKHSGSVFPHTWRNVQYIDSQLFCSGKNSWIIISKVNFIPLICFFFFSYWCVGPSLPSLYLSLSLCPFPAHFCCRDWFCSSFQYPLLCFQKVLNGQLVILSVFLGWFCLFSWMSVLHVIISYFLSSGLCFYPEIFKFLIWGFLSSNTCYSGHVKRSVGVFMCFVVVLRGSILFLPLSRFCSHFLFPYYS